MLHNLENAPGAVRKKRKRIGRGSGSTDGKTAGRGHKGQRARAGSGKKIGYEGGQMPLHRRLPKRGFKNVLRQEYSIVNLADIIASKKIDFKKTINAEVLAESGLIQSARLPLKILGDGMVEMALTIEAKKFSASAEKKIKDAGGTVNVI